MQNAERPGKAAQSHASANVEGRLLNAENAAAAQPLRAIPEAGSSVRRLSRRRQASVRIADFSMAVTVVDHVVARPPQVWGFMEAISEVWGCSAGGVK
jgi:hypothetical protein